MSDLPPLIASLTPLPILSDSRTYRIATSLTRHGYRSVVIEGLASVPSRPTPFELRDASRAAEQSNSAKNDPAVATSSRRTFTAVSHLLERHLLDPLRALPPADLYYLHSYVQAPALMVRRARSHAPFVYDAHDFYPDLLPAPRNAFQRFAAACDRWACRHASRVVTVSSGVANLYRAEYGVQPMVIRNCHDRRLDEPVDRRIRDVLGLSARELLCVVVGNYKPQMALAPAISALRHVPAFVHLAFLGKGYASTVQNLAKAERLENRVHVVDPVLPTQVVPFIGDADAGVVIYRPVIRSVERCLPNGFFQCVAAHLPMLVPGDLPEIVLHAPETTLTMNADDPVDIARCLLAMIDTRDRGTSLGAQSGVPKDDLSWEDEELVLLGLIDELLGNRQNSS